MVQVEFLRLIYLPPKKNTAVVTMHVCPALPTSKYGHGGQLTVKSGLPPVAPTPRVDLDGNMHTLASACLIRPKWPQTTGAL